VSVIDGAKEMLEQQRAITALRQENASLRLANQSIQLLIAIIERYQAAIRSTGAIPSDDELAMVAIVRRESQV
jgi:hypothetical protein